MNYPSINRFDATKVLFVWDGTDRFISTADQFVGSLKNASVTTVRAMPHASVYGYGLLKPEDKNELNPVERRLHLAYKKAVKRTWYLKHSNFELVFGERINEIARFSKVIKANLILIPRFEQSTFSTWIHGDLNERLPQIAPCPVLFLDINADRERKTGSRTSSAEAG